jgi:hypothetical protein
MSQRTFGPSKINYLNNPLLRAANTPHSYTEEEMIEIAKCARDPEYFIENYIKIVHPDRGLVLMKLYDPQRKIVQTYHKEQKVVVLASRQTGKTTTTAGYFCWYMLFYNPIDPETGKRNPKAPKNIAILAHKAAAAKEVLERFKTAYENLPRFLQRGVQAWNKSYVLLENGSRIIAAATTGAAIRGMTINLLYLDEFAFVHQNIAEEFFTSVYPTISAGLNSKLFITSTPKGFNYFYKIWNDAETGENDFVPVEMHWSEIPGRDETWKKKTIKDIGEDKFLVEYDNQFLGSSNTLIPSRFMKTFSAWKPLKKTENSSVYAYPVRDSRDPKKNHQYVIVVDPARGTGLDASAFVVFDITDWPVTIAAVYHSAEVSPLTLPIIVEQVAKNYNNADVLVEINDNGQQVADILYYDLEYANTVSLGAHEKSAGIKTTHPVKRKGCMVFRDLVETQKIIINDLDLIKEISTFVAKKQGYEADVGMHDDIVMCCVLFSWFTTTDYFLNIKDMNFRQKIQQEKEKHIEDDVMSFGIVFNSSIDGGEIYQEYLTEEEEQFRRFVQSDRVVWSTK